MAKDPEFIKLVGEQPKIEKISEGFKFTEGPVHSRRGYLLFSDIPTSGKVVR
jgi:gluconolactonase